MSRELLKLAFEAIERGVKDGYWNKDTVDVSTQIQKYLAEQPARQEPVAWMSKDADIVYTSIQVDGCFQHDHIPLYTTPYVATPRPQRTWVGLDNDDLVWIYSNSDKVGQAISNTEAKLKEKNNGT